MLKQRFNPLLNTVWIKSFAVVGLFAALSAFAGAATAASSPWVQAEEAQIRLISTSSTVGTEKKIRLGMEFNLTPHWKIYWRSPGEAGLPPIPDYTGSTNFEAGEFQWPLPERFAYQGIETFGYQDNVVFPIDVVLDEAGKATDVQVAVDYLICEELCIPGSANLSLSLPAGEATIDAEASLIRLAMQEVPQATSEFMAVEDFQLDMSGEAPKLTVSTSSVGGFEKPELIIEGPEGFFFNPPVMTASADQKFATFTSTAEFMYDAGTPMSRDAIRITLVDGAKAVDVSSSDMANAGIPAASASVAKAPLSFSLLLSMLFAALIGGLILNLMPCVLPVLSIKLMSVIDKSGKSSRDVRMGFLATTAGIITSFLVLALALIALKAGGAAIGWGVQFQQPIFVLVLLAIILLFAANMFGWFEITLPAALSGLGSGSKNKGLASDFATGAFATLLATPCSAPFLGTAVSFALAQSAATILLIFAALGVGMALPYILVILFPKLVNYLPKPGMWMVKLRMVLGGLLVLTAAWLMTILLAQLGWTAVYIAVAISVGLIAALWIFRAQAKTLPLVALAISVALVLVPPMFKSVEDLSGKQLEKPWVMFDQAKIADHIADGKVVYVDVTADWCVTCKVNKAVVFASGEVNKVFADKNTVAMLADWTRPSDEINAYLQSFNRAGIPFNAIYSAKYPNGRALPEILTPNLVLEELANAR